MLAHRLSEYAAALAPYATGSSIAGDPVIAQVTYDSREVVPGALFICKGLHFAPAYLSEALARGAVAYVSEAPYPEYTETAPLPDRPAQPLSWITVSDIRAAIAEVGTLFYDHEWDALELIGITGTKGKSTTTLFTHYILSEWMSAMGGPRVGLISSIRDDDGVTAKAAVKTTPETLDLYRNLHNAVHAGLTHMCIEVSSQGLKYRRVANLKFHVGCFLNIAEDHISPLEHADFDDYLTSKLQLFEQSRVAVVNARTAEADRVLAAARQSPRVVTFAVGTDWHADVVGYDVVDYGAGQEFSVRSGLPETGGATPSRYNIGLMGKVNVANAVAAIAIAQVLSVPDQYIRAGLAKARVPGRGEVYRLARGTTAIVDYAHQTLSLEALLATVRERYPGAPITMIFGTGGNVGWNRRQQFGNFAGHHATTIYLTEDDPGDQAVETICAEINRHIEATGHAPGIVEPDRRRAVERALDAAPDNGVVLILGKGAEAWQMRACGAVPVPSDVDVVTAYLERN